MDKECYFWNRQYENRNNQNFVEIVVVLQWWMNSNDFEPIHVVVRLLMLTEYTKCQIVPKIKRKESPYTET